jgi:ornithine decarboxylase
MPVRRLSASPSATPSRRSATSRAYELGIRLFAVDCVEEVEKIARVAPQARVFCRVLTDGEGAEWPLSRKFGCVPAMASTCCAMRKLGLDAYGVSFHVGSQQTDLTAWDRAWRWRRGLRTLAEEASCWMVNMGGGFPTRYLKDVPAAQAYGQAIFEALQALRQPHS